MDIKKHLFRISERCLKSSNASCYWQGIFYFFSIIGSYFTILLIFGHLLVLPNNNTLSACLTTHNIVLKNDSIYMVYDGSLPD